MGQIPPSSADSTGQSRQTANAGGADGSGFDASSGDARDENIWERATNHAVREPEHPSLAVLHADHGRFAFEGERMKRKAGALMMLAALGGGCMSTEKAGPAMHQHGATARARTAPGVQAAWGESVAMKNKAQPAAKSGIIQAKATSMDNSSGIVQVAGRKSLQGGGMGAPPPGSVAALGSLPGLPVGGPGAQAGMGGPGAQNGSRTSCRFTGPAGMKVAWFNPGAPSANNGFSQAQLEVPGRYNFVQGGVYRLKLTDVPNRPALELYPTLDVRPSNYRTCEFLAHSSVPISFTEEDFEQVAAGNLVIKVVYLPDPQFQDLAVAGPDEIVSTRLEPGVDPILEAERRGSVLLVIRMGNIDLESPNTPAVNAPQIGVPPMPGMGGMPLMAPPGGVMPGQMPPNQLPPGIAPGAPNGVGVPARPAMNAPPVTPIPQTKKNDGGKGVVQVGGILGRMSK
jgi:hypothetical protein